MVTFYICISVVCYSAILHEFDDVDFEKILVSGFDVNLNHIKQSYLKQIHELKEKAVNCTFDGSCFEIAEKVAVSSQKSLIIVEIIVALKSLIESWYYPIT